MGADFEVGRLRFPRAQRYRLPSTIPMKKSLILILLVVGSVPLFSGCDAIESLNEENDGNVTEQQPVSQQTGQIVTSTPSLRADYIKEMLIGPPEGEWPAPLPLLEWRSSLETGWQAVREEGRPLLVLIHCPVSNRAGALDQRLLSPTPELAELLRQFVTVELTDGRDLDLNRMPFARYQDPDQVCWCWILSPQGQVYSVLGREHPDSPEIPDAGISSWLKRVLDHHWDPRRTKWNADGPVFPEDLPTLSIAQNAGYDRWRKGAEHLGTLRENGECMCCHQVQDTLWAADDLKRQFRVTEDFWLWPPPANTGLEFADESLPRVTQVTPGSFAAQVRTQPEATFGVVNERRIFSTTDVRAVLNSVRRSSGLKIYSELDGEVVSSTLGITRGASRDYDLTWRTSIADSVLAGHPGFLPVAATAGVRNELRLQNRMAVVPQVAEGTPAWERGVRPNQVIIKLGENTSDLTPEQFLFLFTLNNQVGSLARLTVRQGDANWQPAQLEIPSISVLEIPPETLKPQPK